MNDEEFETKLDLLKSFLLIQEFSDDDNTEILLTFCQHWDGDYSSHEVKYMMEDLGLFSEELRFLLI